MNKLLDLLSDKKIRLMLIFILVVIFIIIIIATMSKEDKNVNNTEEPEFIETNEKLQEELFKKVKELRYGDYCEIQATNIYNDDCLYRKVRTVSKDLSQAYRIYTLALTLDDSNNNAIVGNIIVENYSFPSGTKFIDLDRFTKGYNSLYGRTTTFNPLGANHLKVFPVVKYDEKRSRFYYQTEGGEEKPRRDKVVEYLENIESDKHRVYLYVNVAFVAYEEDGSVKVYNDRGKLKLIETYTQIDYSDEKAINDQNHALFKEYKYTFYQEKESNNLIFEQVELVN